MHTIEHQVLAALRLKRDGVPIYVQIREQLLDLIARGVAPPGARMPTMRQVAVGLRVDLNTVRHAYEDLQRQGVIVLRRGLGSFVAERPAPAGPVPPPPGPEESSLDDMASRVLSEARQAGLEPLDLIRRLAELTSMRKGDEP